MVDKGKHLENVCWAIPGPPLLRTGLDSFLLLRFTVLKQYKFNICSCIPKWCVYVRTVLMTLISLQTRYSLEYTYIWCLVELLMKLSYVGTSKSVWELYLSRQPIWLHVEASPTKRLNKRDRIIKKFPLCLCFCGYWKKSSEWSCLDPFSRKLRYFNKGNIV